MKTYTVWFVSKGSNLINPDVYIFIHDVPGYSLAVRIAENLMTEGFTVDAWVEAD